MKWKGAGDGHQPREQGYQECEEEERGSGHAARRVGNATTIKNFTQSRLEHGRPPQVRERGPSRGGRGGGRAPGEGTSARVGGQEVLKLAAIETSRWCQVSHVATWGELKSQSPARGTDSYA